MRFACQPVTADFFASSPLRFQHAAELPVPAEQAFAVLEDGAAWPAWFNGIRQVTWTTPQPFGVGTERTVVLSSMTVFEHFFRWEPGRRFSFYFTAHQAPAPVFRALAEDYLLEPLPGGRCRFEYTVAIEPAPLLKLAWPLARGTFAGMFSAAPGALARYLEPRAGSGTTGASA